TDVQGRPRGGLGGRLGDVCSGRHVWRSTLGHWREAASVLGNELASIASCVASRLGSSADIFAPHITRMRWLTPSTSRMSDETLITASPCARSPSIARYTTCLAPTSTPRVGTT